MADNFYTNVLPKTEGLKNVFVQKFDANITSRNAANEVYFGEDEIVLIDVSGEGVISGQLSDGTTGFLTTRSVVNTFDLISEGEIEGVVSGEFQYSGKAEEGQIGYQSGEMVAYSTGVESFLRSIYLNETPIVNSNNQYNFQAAQVSVSNGTPSGIVSGDIFLNLSHTTTGQAIERTRVINERLRGPDVNDQNEENPFHYYPKVYRFLNKDLDKLRVHFKIPALSYTKVEQQITQVVGESTGSSPAATNKVEKTNWPLDDLGQVRASKLKFSIRYRPIETDSQGNVNYAASRRWYGPGGTGGNDQQPFVTTVRGLIRSPYVHDYTVPLAEELKTERLVGWEVEITRNTLESIESHIQNQSYVDSISEVYESTLSYPSSAVAAMSFDAEYFSQVPTRAYDCKLLKVKVPDNYDPLLRSYNSEPWGGNFKTEKEWTDNPAWIFYDLVTNSRYGLGKYLGDVEVDKWTLYEISKFCDTLVSDGDKGYEPRFTCNVLINTREDAIKVLKDFASVFRSIIYYGYGNIYPAMDKPRPTIAQFNNSNVIDGNFKYTSASKKTLPTVCLVRYNDKQNFYKPAIEYVENTEAIRKYGVVEREVTAFACTSQTQALRLGRWILATESEQKETISFDTGPEAMLLRPNDIVKVTDTNRSEDKFGGRAIRANATGIIFDRIITGLSTSSKDFSLSLTTPTYFYDPTIVNVTTQLEFSGYRRPLVQTYDFNPSSTPNINISNISLTGVDMGYPNGVSGSGTQIYLTAGSMFSTTDTEITDESVWSLGDVSEKNTNLYTVTSTKENDSMSFTVDALLHSTGKFGYIESGVYYSYIPSVDGAIDHPTKPYEVELSNEAHPQSDSKHTKRIKIKIKPCNGAADSCSKGSTVAYKVYLKKGARTWSSDDLENVSSSVPKEEFLLQTIYFSDNTESGDPVLYYTPPKNGDYAIRVYALNRVNVRSTDKVDGHWQSKEDGTAGDGGDGITISNHFPVKDVEIHSLRLNTNYFFNEAWSPDDPVVKESYDTANNKDVSIQWDASFLDAPIGNFPIFYKVSVHDPSASITPGVERGQFTGITTNVFDFTFARNRAVMSPSAPKRKYDLVVTAHDEDGNYSSGIFDGVSMGWDIMGVSNPKPTGLYITPKRSAYKKVAYQQACDPSWTDQFIDADGYVHLDLLSLDSTRASDIAGGFAYVSKHPFSGKDFHTNGVPMTPQERIDYGALSFASDELFKTGEYAIEETQFTAPVGTTFTQYDSKITFKPDLSGPMNPPYYMAVKFYDDFDREIHDNSLDANWNVGLINDWDGNAMDAGTSTGLWLSFGRNTTGSAGELITEKYCMSKSKCEYYNLSPDVGGATCYPAKLGGTSMTSNSTFAVPIYPTKYYSANQGGFKYWLRMNINGQWEGQGISHVKVLTQKDVKDLYDYKGFYEYGCKLQEQQKTVTDSWGTYRRWYPNDVEGSFTRCNFRQTSIGDAWQPRGRGNEGVFGRGTIGDGFEDGNELKFWGGLTTDGAPYFITTGATRNWNNWGDLPRELTRAGIAWGYDIAYRTGNLDASYDIRDTKESAWTASQGGHNKLEWDKLNSYNERGQLITSKTRPLRGFRRFRVYFDENNLPFTSDTDGLASYSVVGMNSWNGKYESWQTTHNWDGTLPSPSDPMYHQMTGKNMLTAKDGYNIFPSSVVSWLNEGDLFENIPGVWNHHPAGFGQGFGGLAKTQRFFDIHMGRMIDDSYLNEAFFGVVTTNDYSIQDQLAQLPAGYTQETQLHEAVYDITAYVTSTDGTDLYD